jgi:hypothetical protein
MRKGYPQQNNDHEGNIYIQLNSDSNRAVAVNGWAAQSKVIANPLLHLLELWK